VHVFDADPDKTAAASLAGGYPAESAADCARAGELFFTSLPRPGRHGPMLARSLPCQPARCGLI